jgi:hypothetical protein
VLLGKFDSVITYGDGIPHPKYNAIEQLNVSGKREGRIVTGFPNEIVKATAKSLGLKTAKAFDELKVAKAFAKKQVAGVLSSKMFCAQADLSTYEVDFEKFSNWLKVNFRRLLKTRDKDWAVPQIRETSFYSFLHKEEHKPPMWYQSKQTLSFAKMFANMTPIVFNPKFLTKTPTHPLSSPILKLKSVIDMDLILKKFEDFDFKDILEEEI